jgi:PleD family two-component response regulator
MIVDVNMTTRDGLEVPKRRHQTRETASVRPILLAGGEQDRQILPVFGRGTADYITKPFNLLAFTTRVEPLSDHTR